MLHLPKNIVSMKGQFICSKSVYLGTKCTFIFLVLNHDTVFFFISASLHWRHFQTYSFGNVRRCLPEITAQNQSCTWSSSHNNKTMLSSPSRNFQTERICCWTLFLRMRKERSAFFFLDDLGSLLPLHV